VRELKNQKSIMMGKGNKKNHGKITKAVAHDILYNMWENGEVPSNFTEDHSEYERAIECIIKHGFLIMEDFFSKF
jgi:hypothetical protein